MSDATEALRLAFDKLAELANTYGPPAVNTAAEVVRINAIGSLIATGIIAAIAAAAGAIGAGAWRSGSRLRREQKAANPHRYYYSAGETQFIAASLAGAVGGMALLVTLARVSYVWTWVALYDPKLALAAKVVNALPGIGQ